MININKYIAQAGVTSRRGADELIKAGRVRINDKLAMPIDKVGSQDHVFIDSKEIKLENKKIYLAFNKPVGVICTTDKNSPNNIIDAVKYPKRVFPIGRLDVNSSGLILLTNDGDLAQRVMKGKEIEKEYEVTVAKTIDAGFLKSLENGVILDGFKTLPAKTQRIGDREFQITIVEGRNRQIRRMCECFGFNVLKLKRIRIGQIRVDRLAEGHYIEIPAEKITKLLNATDTY